MFYVCMHTCIQTDIHASMHACIHAYQCISHIYIYIHILHLKIITKLFNMSVFSNFFSGVSPSSPSRVRRPGQPRAGSWWMVWLHPPARWTAGWKKWRWAWVKWFGKCHDFTRIFEPKMMGISAWLKDQKPILTSHKLMLQTAKREVTESQSGTSAYIREWMMPQASKNCISACQPEMPRRKAIEDIWTCHVLPKPARKMFRSQESVCQTRISRMTRNWCKRWRCEWKGLRWCR